MDLDVARWAGESDRRSPTGWTEAVSESGERVRDDLETAGCDCCTVSPLLELLCVGSTACVGDEGRASLSIERLMSWYLARVASRVASKRSCLSRSISLSDLP